MTPGGNWSTSWNSSSANINIGAPRGVRRAAIQGRTGDQDMRGKVKYSCSECQIFYYMPEGSKAHCPLCDQKQVTQRVRDALHQATNANNELHNEVERLKVQVDTLAAMRIALEAISVEDLTFIKSVVYRWQADRGKVAIKPTHKLSGRGKKRGAKIDGFVAIFREGETEVHQCNSVGGIALAGYLEEAMGISGQMKGMEVLVRAVLQHLQATVES